MVCEWVRVVVSGRRMEVVSGVRGGVGSGNTATITRPNFVKGGGGGGGKRIRAD